MVEPGNSEDPEIRDLYANIFPEEKKTKGKSDSDSSILPKEVEEKKGMDDSFDPYDSFDSSVMSASFMAENQDLFDERDEFTESVDEVHEKTLLKIDQVICGHFILEKLGTGGMGEVYKAMNIKTKKAVAIKILLHKSKNAMERFKREYEFLSAVNHPNLIKAYDFKRLNGKALLFMEFVEGQSLKDILQSRKKVSLGDKLAIAIQVAKGVEALNLAGIIHRDIKPANIMVNLPKKSVKILDLGLSKDVEGHANTLTLEKQILGTCFYMAPEQTEGVVTTTTDIFALGTVLYQFFTNQIESPFFSENQYRTFVMIATQNPPKITDIIAMPAVLEYIYEEIDTVISKAMAKSPSERTRNAGVLVQQLTEIYRKVTSNDSNSKRWELEDLSSMVMRSIVDLKENCRDTDVQLSEEELDMYKTTEKGTKATKKISENYSVSFFKDKENNKKSIPATITDIDALDETKKDIQKPVISNQIKSLVQTQQSSLNKPTNQSNTPKNANESFQGNQENINVATTNENAEITSTESNTLHSEELMREVDELTQETKETTTDTEEATQELNSSPPKSKKIPIKHNTSVKSLGRTQRNSRRLQKTQPKKQAKGMSYREELPTIIMQADNSFNKKSATLKWIFFALLLSLLGYSFSSKKISIFSFSNKNVDIGEVKNFDAFPEGWSEELWKFSWNGEYVDFTNNYWESLSTTEQLNNTKTYQQWYAKIIAKVSLEKTIQVDNVDFILVLIPPGKFLMGAPQKEKGREVEEVRHPVIITTPFWIGKHEVTQEQWRSVTRTNPSFRKMYNHPVEQVSWHEVNDFCQKSDFRLPTEAEWEYSCRGGVTSSFYWGEDWEVEKANTLEFWGKANVENQDWNTLSKYLLKIAKDKKFTIEKDVINMRDDLGKYNVLLTLLNEQGIIGTTPIMQYEANSFSIHDTLGNVLEWCSDKYAPNYYLITPEENPQGAEESEFISVRGGSSFVASRMCRIAYRYRIPPTYKFMGLGFRVVKTFSK